LATKLNLPSFDNILANIILGFIFAKTQKVW